VAPGYCAAIVSSCAGSASLFLWPLNETFTAAV
jgi:hypothetical protein